MREHVKDDPAVGGDAFGFFGVFLLANVEVAETEEGNVDDRVEGRDGNVVLFLCPRVHQDQDELAEEKVGRVL